jgi:hypothetical protein
MQVPEFWRGSSGPRLTGPSSPASSASRTTRNASTAVSRPVALGYVMVKGQPCRLARWGGSGVWSLTE